MISSVVVFLLSILNFQTGGAVENFKHHSIWSVDEEDYMVYLYFYTYVYVCCANKNV